MLYRYFITLVVLVALASEGSLSALARVPSVTWHGQAMDSAAASMLSVFNWNDGRPQPESLFAVVPAGARVTETHLCQRKVQMATFRFDGSPAAGAPTVHATVHWIRVSEGSRITVDAHFERVDGDASLDGKWAQVAADLQCPMKVVKNH